MEIVNKYYVELLMEYPQNPKSDLEKMSICVYVVSLCGRKSSNKYNGPILFKFYKTCILARLSTNSYFFGSRYCLSMSFVVNFI